MSESEIKVGDRFELTASVVLVDGPAGERYRYCMQLGGAPTSRVWVDDNLLLSSKRIEPALKVGDHVRLRGSSISRGEIVAIKGEFAFVDWEGDGWKHRVPFSDLERVP